MKNEKDNYFGEVSYSKYINITKNENEIFINVNRPFENMQSDKANFESLALMCKCLNNKAKIVIGFKELKEWDGKFSIKSSKANSYLRFLYRIINFRDAFPEWVIIEKNNLNEIARFEKLLNFAIESGKISNNIPDKPATFSPDKRRGTYNRKQIISYTYR